MRRSGLRAVALDDDALCRVGLPNEVNSHGNATDLATSSHDRPRAIVDVHHNAEPRILPAMEFSAPRRSPLFAADPIGELVGLAKLTDPDDDVAAVIDLAVIGARGDGKTQFIVHAIRALHAHAPALEGAEQGLNQDVMRLVLDPRATRPDATPPGVVPHFTFRVRTAGLFDRLGWRGAVRLAMRATRIGVPVAIAILLVLGGLGIGAFRDPTVGIVIGATGALVGAAAALVARRRLSRFGDVEIVFWDVAGEQVYSSAAADYYTLLGRLVDARRRRADALGRAYTFAPVLICNPLALGTDDEGSPYERLRELVPLFAALDRDAPRALVAINRWSVVDPICARGAPRDEVVTITARGRGEDASPPREVAREQVRAHCLDAEDGRDGDVRIAYLRYDTAIRAGVEADPDAATLAYEFDDGPGAFSGDSRHRFLDWVIGLVRWPELAHAAPVEEPIQASPAPAQGPIVEPIASAEVWARPMDATRQQ